jgi:hypothetical protein
VGKSYSGKRTPAGCVVVVVVDGDAVLLNPRWDVRNHSPDGYEWGYGGSGPAQLALALCCDCLGDEAKAERVYQRFKAEVVARIATDCWAIDHGDLYEWLALAMVDWMPLHPDHAPCAFDLAMRDGRVI